ncbi:hypothetical protein ABT095_20985 [Kitasatospora sp. NPDC002227]|uniref:hypothetical protein n=1 Tax=Kitasatospora sp. NPDC002227 TaxID=3154773 RepID=UPI0033190F9E
MNRIRTQLAAQLTLLLAALLLPLQFAAPLVQRRIGRVRAARQGGDRGAISIELALAIVALVIVAIGVVAALRVLGKNVTDQVTQLPTAPPSP